MFFLYCRYKNKDFPLINMSNIMQNPSPTSSDGTGKSQTPKQSLKSKTTSLDKDTVINSITGYENDLIERLEILEREAEMQSQQIELGECLEFVVQLVDLFKRAVIATELQNENGCHNDTSKCLPRHKSTIGNTHIDDKIEKVIISKGLTKEQWRGLHFMALSNGESTEINKVSIQHLHKVRDMVSRLLGDDEQNAASALINVIEVHMPKQYFTDK